MVDYMTVPSWSISSYLDKANVKLKYFWILYRMSPRSGRLWPAWKLLWRYLNHFRKKILLFWFFSRVNSKLTNQRSSFCLCFDKTENLTGQFFAFSEFCKGHLKFIFFGISDYAFGRCVSPYDAYDGDFGYTFGDFEPEVVEFLENEVTRLYENGYTWNDDYTQCVLQTSLAAIRDQWVMIGYIVQ